MSEIEKLEQMLQSQDNAFLIYMLTDVETVVMDSRKESEKKKKKDIKRELASCGTITSSLPKDTLYCSKNIF